jgi:hypothetical protein
MREEENRLVAQQEGQEGVGRGDGRQRGAGGEESATKDLQKQTESLTEPREGRVTCWGKLDQGEGG